MVACGLPFVDAPRAGELRESVAQKVGGLTIDMVIIFSGLPSCSFDRGRLDPVDGVEGEGDNLLVVQGLTLGPQLAQWGVAEGIVEAGRWSGGADR